MNMEEKIYSLMVQAEDLQKVADTAFADLDKSIKRLEEDTIKTISSSIQKILGEGNVSFTEAADSLHKAKEKMDNSIKSIKYELIFYTILVFFISSLLMVLTFYFAVTWTFDERDRLQSKVDNLDYTLQKFAQITEVTGKDGFFVFIDPKVEPFKTQDGRKVAKLAPPRIFDTRP